MGLATTGGNLDYLPLLAVREPAKHAGYKLLLLAVIQGAGSMMEIWEKLIHEAALSGWGGIVAVGWLIVRLLGRRIIRGSAADGSY
jgi:hypothetical protein